MQKVRISQKKMQRRREGGKTAANLHTEEVLLVLPLVAIISYFISFQGANFTSFFFAEAMSPFHQHSTRCFCANRLTLILQPFGI
jgi:hypothetical protein